MSSIFIDFRQSGAFVTDPAGAAAAVSTTTYPNTAGGATYGWTAGAVGDADRLNTNIAQLAGINFINNADATGLTFQVDLAGLGGAGTYKIGLALGDATNGQGRQFAVAKDGASTLFSVDASQGTANHFIDATGADTTNTTWLAGQAYQTVIIAGSAFTLNLGAKSAGGFTCIACLYLEKQVITTSPTMFRRSQTFPRRRR